MQAANNPTVAVSIPHLDPVTHISGFKIMAPPVAIVCGVIITRIDLPNITAKTVGIEAKPAAKVAA